MKNYAIQKVSIIMIIIIIISIIIIIMIIIIIIPNACIFNLQLFWFILKINKKSGIETPDRNGQWYQHLLYYLPFFTRAIPKGLTFGLDLYVLRLCNAHVLYCIQHVRDLTCEKP